MMHLMTQFEYCRNTLSGYRLRRLTGSQSKQFQCLILPCLALTIYYGKHIILQNHSWPQQISDFCSFSYSYLQILDVSFLQCKCFCMDNSVNVFAWITITEM